jgi:hypothetical protein
MGAVLRKYLGMFSAINDVHQTKKTPWQQAMAF